MAKCKLCKKTIDNGTEYCIDCTDKKDLVANESYLDDLLNSMRESTTTASDIYKKKQPSFSVDLDDLRDFDQYDIMNDLDNPITIGDEELFGDDDKITSADSSETGQDDNLELEHNIDNEFLEMSDSEIHNDEDGYIDPAFDELLNQLDTSEDTLQDKTMEPEEELLNLLNQIDPENPVESDIIAISSLLGGIDNNQQEKEFPEDVGEVFSEALEAVSTLADTEEEAIDTAQEPDDSKDKKSKKKKKSTKKEKSTENKKDKKEGLFTKLFSNIEEDEPLNPEKKKVEEDTAEVKETKKKKKKKSKGKENQTADQESAEEASGKSKKETEDKEEKKNKKKAKKEKKKIEIIDDAIDEGHINRVGASIVFVVFGILVMLLLISTNIFSYSLSIKNATDYFGRHRYTQAYNEVYGIDIKDEDIELYDKIMTVMYVNKQLNSYNNYYHMKKMPEALDSLLKGLQRYDKYIELATILGIKTDLDYVRNQIIAELYNVFSLTEEQAVNIINSESQAKYSIAVYNVVLENILFY